MPEISPQSRPFHVYAVLDGKRTFHSGHDSEALAKGAVTIANGKGKALGLKCYYEAQAKPAE